MINAADCVAMHYAKQLSKHCKRTSCNQCIFLKLGRPEHFCLFAKNPEEWEKRVLNFEEVLKDGKETQK